METRHQPRLNPINDSKSLDHARMAIHQRADETDARDGLRIVDHEVVVRPGCCQEAFQEDVFLFPEWFPVIREEAHADPGLKGEDGEDEADEPRLHIGAECRRKGTERR